MEKDQCLRFVDALRLAGHLMIDAPARKLAVFPNLSGEVTIVCVEDGEMSICSYDVAECDELIIRLQEAKEASMPLHKERMAEDERWATDNPHLV